MATLIDSIVALDRPALPQAVHGEIRLIPVGPQRWRVVTRSGVAAGHLEVHGEGAARRYRARRFHAATNSFRDVGDFWSPAEAVECLRLYR